MDLSVEEIKALFFDEEALLETPVQVYRLNHHSAGRYYYKFIKGEPIFYLSVTNMIHASMPTSPHLIKWMSEMGYEAAEAYKEERAGYGTFMHIQFQKILIERGINLDAIAEELKDYILKENYPISSYNKWLYEIKFDILGFAQFLLDANVQPIAIELVLASDKYGYAGAVDLCCYMDIIETGFYGETYKSGDRKGEPKESKRTRRIIAIIDFKSGKKGFWDSHEVQLNAYKEMFEENFPHVKVEKIFNYAPTDWRTVPGYKIKDQTDGPNKEKLRLFVELAKIERKKKDKVVTIIEGVLDLEKGHVGLEDNYKEISLDSFVKGKQKQ